MAAGANTADSSEDKVDLIASVPVIDFVDDVDSFMAFPENAGNAQVVLKKMEDTYSKIKMMEQKNLALKQRLRNQISELSKSIEVISELKSRKDASQDMSSHFRLADHVFLKAKIKPAEKIGLWLGANIMVEYDLDEGDELLRSKREKHEQSLSQTQGLIDHIRENVTTIEVNMARVFNWDVKRRQAEKEQAGIASSTTS